jgi:photosystem II stability/assembly factor-like uncharacterized protein
MTVYVALEDRLFAVDGGERTRRFEGRMECVAVDPTEPTRLLCGTFDEGLYRSTDGGETFVRARGIDQEAVMSVAFDPADPDVVWAGTEPSRVYRSTDGGETFEERGGLTALPSADEWSFPPRPETHHVRWLEPDPGDPDHLYVGIEAGALVQSHDAGATWEDRVPSSRRDNHTLTTHPDAPDRAWSAAGDGYAETTDGGETWRHPQEGLEHRYCWGLAVDPGDPETVLVSAASGARTAHTHRTADAHLYRKRGDGGWESLDGNGVPTGEGALRAVLAAGDAPGELYAANNHGCYRTGDAGDDWERLVAWPETLRESTVRGVAVA